MAALPTEMKTWRVAAYGADGNPADAIDKMTCDTVPMPEPKEGQVLIKVESAAVNPIDWKLFSGGLDGIAPVSFPYTPGFDVAGSVAKLGAGVSSLAVGDAVCVDLGLVESCKKDTTFGPAGAFAEYAVAPESLVSKRGDVPAAKLVGLPLAGLTAYQGIFTGAARSFAGEELGKLESGQKLLVLGGAAATGCLAIQLAKNAGAHVATTASLNTMPDGSTKIAFVEKMGADMVINYKEQDWAEVLDGKDYDLIFDCVGDEADWPKASKVLKKGGSFVSIANFSGPTSTADHNFKCFLVISNKEDLDKLVELVSAGKLVVPVDSTQPFEDVPAVLRKSMAWSSAGKLVVQVSK